MSVTEQLSDSCFPITPPLIQQSPSDILFHVRDAVKVCPLIRAPVGAGDQYIQIIRINLQPGMLYDKLDYLAVSPQGLPVCSICFPDVAVRRF